MIDDVLYLLRGYEWWIMQEAKKRNPDIILYALSLGVNERRSNILLLLYIFVVVLIILLMIIIIIGSLLGWEWNLLQRGQH